MLDEKQGSLYDYAKSFLKDKDKAVLNFRDRSLNQLQSMFIYANLPDTIPAQEVERILQTKGNVFVTKVDDKLYALSGSPGGEMDEYDRPRFYTVANAALKLSKTYEIGVDGILIKNDYNGMGLLPIIYRYAALTVDAELSLNVASILTRITMMISAPDDRTKASAELFIQKILNGDFTVVGETQFFEGVRMQNGASANAAYVTHLVELLQYQKASFFNELGLNANFNMKRERLSQNETAMNIDALLPFVDNMFFERQKGWAAVNDMFGTNVLLDYSSAWKVTHEHAEREQVETTTDLTVTGITPDGEEITILSDERQESETAENESDVETMPQDAAEQPQDAAKAAEGTEDREEEQTPQEAAESRDSDDEEKRDDE